MEETLTKLSSDFPKFINPVSVKFLLLYKEKISNVLLILHNL